MPDSYDIATGLLGGLNKGIMSYYDAKRGREDKAAEMAARGLIQDESGQWVQDPIYAASETKKRQSDLRAKAALEGRIPKFDEAGELTEAPRSPDELAYLRDKSDQDPFGLKAMAANEARRKQEQANKGTPLPSDKVLAVQEGAQIPKMLDDLEGSLTTNKKMLGPISGRVAGINPYNETAQTMDSQLRTVRQAIGKYMEGGVLRKEDEVKYERMLPKLSDTPEVAANKLALVRKMLADKHNASVGALKSSGYDTAAFGQVPSSDLPGVLTGKDVNKKSGFLGAAGGLIQPGAGASGGFPRQIKKGNQSATVSNEQELREAMSEGWQ